MLKEARERTSELMRTFALFEPNFSIGGITISLADEPIADRFGGYLGEDGHKTYRGLKPTYGTEGEAAGTLRDYAKLRQLIGEIERDGIRVIKLPYKDMVRNFRRDVIGWRTGDEIYYTDERNGVPLTLKEQIVTLKHEYDSGHNHESTDEEAQERTIEGLKRYHPSAVGTAFRMLTDARSDANWN